MAENKYYGLYQGIVTKIDDPEKRGRIKVICPDILGADTESAWCDPLVPVAYDNGGDFCIPTTDEAVWLQFIAGDVNRPVWLGGWWQKNMTPLGNNYTSIDKVRVISYADCTITLQNGKININTGSGAFDLSIQNEKVIINGNLVVNGTVLAQSMSTSGEGGVINASVIEASDNITAKTISVDSVSSTTINATNISANSVSAPSIVANNVSLSEHTHKGVASGNSNTGVPNS